MLKYIYRGLNMDLNHYKLEVVVQQYLYGQVENVGKVIQNFNVCYFFYFCQDKHYTKLID